MNLLGRLPGPRRELERVDLNLQLVQAYAFTGDHQRALQILGETEQIVAPLEDENRKAQVYQRASQIYWLLGNPEVARDYALRAFRIAERIGNQELIQSTLRMLSRVSIALSAFDDAIAYLLQYTDLLRMGQKPPGLAIIYGYLGVAYGRVGSWQRAVEASEYGVTLAQQSELSNTIFFSKMQLAALLADYHQWESSLEILKSLYAQIQGGSPSAPNEFMQFAVHGRVLSNLGKPDAGIEMINMAIHWAQETNYQVFRYLPAIFLAECNLANGRFGENIHGLNISLAAAEKAGDRWAVGFGTRLLAESMMKLSAPDWQKAESFLSCVQA